MPSVITDPCVDVKDQACVEVCPTEAIHGDEEDRTLYIDPDECIDCGACGPVCPTEAIFEEDELPDDKVVWKEVNALWYKDKAAARAKVNELKPA